MNIDSLLRSNANHRNYLCSIATPVDPILLKETVNEVSYL